MAYVMKYTGYISGVYVLRLALAEVGLNVTYFNNTDMGILVSSDQVSPEYDALVRQQGIANNLGNSISWTGDLSNTTYYGMFYTGSSANIDLNLTASNAAKSFGYTYETHTPFVIDQHKYNDTIFNTANLSSTERRTSSKFREIDWSARWFGTITPLFAEVYNFTILMDYSSVARLFIGGVGGMMNSTTPPWDSTMTRMNNGQQLIINISNVNSFSGIYNFTDANSREIVLEYIHYKETNSFIQLYWSSPSTPFGIVPPSAFNHWRNISHYNITIHPSSLCSVCSTAVGSALTSAMVAHQTSFVVYGRDLYGNLLQTGGDVPTMVAVGSNGVAFRGDVKDYGNSTYLVTYYPTVAGQFRMYVTIGCCAPHPNVGLPAELNLFSNLLIQNAPFLLSISPAPLVAARSIAVGLGTVGGLAGNMLSFTVQFRDIHNNPTAISVTDGTSSIPWGVRVEFIDRNTGDSVLPTNDLNSSTISYDNYTSVSYTLSRAGNYDMFVSLYDTSQLKISYITKVTTNAATVVTKQYPPSQAILGSPFRVNIAPNKANAYTSIIRGTNINNHLNTTITNNIIRQIMKCDQDNRDNLQRYKNFLL